MKILIVSDSHRMNGNLKIAIDREKPDMLIHLGDIEDAERTVALWAGAPKTPCVFIKGNCDRYSGSEELRDRAVFPLKGHRFYCCHGHMENVKKGCDGLAAAARAEHCDIALYGHTHVPDFHRDGDLAVLNPGSIRAGRYAVLEIDPDGGGITAELKSL